jgi:hypothetical protein
MPAAPPPAAEATPALKRRDNNQYEYQRDLPADRVRQLIEEGKLSDHEAKFYLPVPAP